MQQKYTARVGDFHNSREGNELWDPVESVHESRLKQVIINRAYNAENAENDIALIELEDCVPDFNQFRAPICLPTATKQHGAGECCHIQVSVFILCPVRKYSLYYIDMTLRKHFFPRCF